jgi:hypothetical protein
MTGAESSTANKAPKLRDEAADVGDSAGGDPTVLEFGAETVKANF